MQENIFVTDVNILWKKLATNPSNNLDLVISINLFHLHAIDDICFERTVGEIISDVTVTEEESFTEQQNRQAEKTNLHQ